MTSREEPGGKSGFSPTDPIPQEIDNVLTHFHWDLLDPKNCSRAHSLSVGCEKVDAIRANSEMPLKVLLYAWPEFVVKIVVEQIRNLFTRLLCQYFRCRPTRLHGRGVNLVSDRGVQPTCRARTAERGEVSSSRLKQ